MLACLVAGRLVQTDFTMVDQTHATFTLEDALSINHVVVFLTGAQPLQQGMAAAVYLQWPGDAAAEWRLLGMISNTKPSAMFRLQQQQQQQQHGGGISNNSSMEMDEMDVEMNTAAAAASNFGGGGSGGEKKSAVLGISLEPEADVARGSSASVSATTAAAPKTVGIDLMAALNRVTEHMTNYMASYTVTLPKPNTIGQREDYIPVKALASWKEAFSRKIKADPSFITGASSSSLSSASASSIANNPFI
ncbi:DUF775-domain-containing protein [Ramicandelaber brevisporus]|nr:DUF775-domain-containing protein [Ramicandelaber brevisporus]